MTVKVCLEVTIFIFTIADSSSHALCEIDASVRETALTSSLTTNCFALATTSNPFVQSSPLEPSKSNSPIVVGAYEI
jgi:hypothetical protein